MMDDDEEASQAAYCLLAMSRAGRGQSDRVVLFHNNASDRPTVMEQQRAPPSAAVPAAASTSSDPAQFMIARILTDLDCVRQGFVCVCV